MTYISPDSVEGLTATIENAQRILSDPRVDWYQYEIHRTKKRCAEDRLSMLMHPGGSTGMKPPTLNHLEPILQRCIRLFDGDEAEGNLFLQNQLTRNGINCDTLEGFDWQRLNSVIQCVADMEKQVKSLKQKRPKKQDVVLKKKEEPKKMGLFANVKLKATEAGAVNTDTGEVVAQSAAVQDSEKERICEEARAALGIGFRTIETREQLLHVLKRRTAALLLYCHVKEEAAKELASLEREIEQIDTVYDNALKDYYKKNVAEGKKTLTTVYGDLGEKYQNTSFSLSDAPTDKSKFEKWLRSRDEDLQKTFKVEVREVYDRNMKAVHEWWDKQDPKPVIPGTVVKEAGERFSIRPSLDTVKKDPEKYVGKHSK